MQLTSLITCLLITLPSTLAVVRGELRRVANYHGMQDVQTCPVLAPGQCCKGAPGTGEFFKSVTLRGLPGNAISAAYRRSRLGSGCDGRVIDLHWGQGTHHYTSRKGSKVTGGSYIACPSSFSGGWAGWLTSNCGSFRRKMRIRRDAQESEPTQGASEVYATVITFEGTDYEENPKGSLQYKDKDGNVLDLNLLKGPEPPAVSDED